MCGLTNASGSDIKAFCCGPVHALVIAGALVSSGVYRQVAVVGGCSLAKLGMKFQGHLHHDQPILEDTLASVAVLVGPDDGVSPCAAHGLGGQASRGGRFQPAGDFHGTGQRARLDRLGLKFGDIDKYATELHNPELTEPAGSGNVPQLNYRLIGALATLKGEIDRGRSAESSLRLTGCRGSRRPRGTLHPPLRSWAMRWRRSWAGGCNAQCSWPRAACSWGV